jgi:hypothetical protein
MTGTCQLLVLESYLWVDGINPFAAIVRCEPSVINMSIVRLLFSVIAKANYWLSDLEGVRVGSAP